ncbi:MAG: Restriction endonuclease [Acidimicrobiaceae bacterium]|jgi:HJR/Mrr/RecB family endonuclease
MRIFLVYTHEDAELAGFLRDRLKEDGNVVIDALNLDFGADLFSSIAALIRSTDAVIGILRGDRPNLYFELGLAAGAGKPVVVASAGESGLASNIGTFPLVVLTGDIASDAEAIARRAYDTQPTQQGPNAPERPSAPMSAQEVGALSPREFEQLVRQLLIERGFTVSFAGDHSDRGYDLVAETDRGSRVLVQVKGWSVQQRVPLTSVQSLAAAMLQSGSAVGLLVSTARFTPAAVALAAQSGVVLKTLDELSEDTSVDEVLQSTPTLELDLPVTPSEMPQLQCRVGTEVLPLNFDTGSESSFGDEAAFIATGKVPPIDEHGYVIMSVSAAGSMFRILTRNAEIDVEVLSEGQALPALLRVVLVRDWSRTPMARTAPFGLIGRSFMVDNGLSLTLSADRVLVTRAG